MTAPTNAGAIDEAIRLSGCATVVTNESVDPPGALKVGRAGRFVREQSLKLRKRPRERQIVSIKYVDNHDHPRLAQMLNILPVVGLGDNRISVVSTFFNSRLGNDLAQFKQEADLVVANCITVDLSDVAVRVYSRKVFGQDLQE